MLMMLIMIISIVFFFLGGEGRGVPILKNTMITNDDGILERLISDKDHQG